MTINGELVGLTSFGVGCSQPKSPGMYGRVLLANVWIHESICKCSQYAPTYCGTGQYTSQESLTAGHGEVKLKIHIQTLSFHHQVATGYVMQCTSSLKYQNQQLLPIGKPEC